MDEKLLKIIKKVFSDYKTSEWDSEKAVSIYQTISLKDAELKYLRNSGFDINQSVFLSHDEIVTQLKNLCSEPRLTWERCLKSFIASMNSYPRGLSPILSYLYMTKLPLHPIDSRDYSDKLCLVCGIVPEQWYEKSIILYDLHTGRIWNNPIGYLFDLQEFKDLEEVEPSETDWCIFNSFITSIETAADEKESVSKLERRIRSEKLFPKFHPGRLRDTLFILAQLGIMPSATLPPLYDDFITMQQIFDSPQIGSHRSDIEPPLNGWKGAFRINKKRCSHIFDCIRK